MTKKACTSSLRACNEAIKCDEHLISANESLENDPSFWLASLPSEVLLEIFSFLSPKELLCLKKLGYERFSELTYMIRTADFYLYRKYLPEDVSSFFSESKMSYLKEVNFNHIMYVKPSILEKCILKCTQLTKLFVIQCGLEYANIHHIFSKCKEIENFAWDPNGNINFPQTSFFPTARKLKTLYLTDDSTYYNYHLDVVLETIKGCPFAEDIRLNFSSQCLFKLPPIIGRLDIFCIKYPIQNQSFVIYFDTYREHVARRIEYCFKLLRGLQVEITPMETIKHLYEENKFINHPSYLQLRNTNEDISKFSTIPDNSIQSLIYFILSRDALVSENAVKSIQRVGGEKLKYFTLRELPHVRRSSDLGLRNLSYASVAIPKILKDCRNIVALNLSEVHVNGTFPFKALCYLKSLEILILPSCAFHIISEEDTGFAEMICACANVKHFSLYGCTCGVGPQDCMLSPIQNWKKLQHLLLCKIVQLRTLSFLVKIADFCIELRSLELIEIGNLEVCHYSLTVGYVLKNSKNLTFLRINQQAFYPMCKVFWKAVGEAKNLEGLCLKTKSKVAIQNKVVTNALSQLQYLYLFHIFAVGRSESLLTRIKQIMSSHGVQRYRLLSDSPNATASDLKCMKQHLPPF